MAINDAGHFLSGNTSIMSMVLTGMHQNSQFGQTSGKHIPAEDETIGFMADPIDLPEWWVDLNGLHHTGKSTGKPYHGITGQYLDERPVNLARQEEIKHGIRRDRIYDKASVIESLCQIGGRPVGTRWVDVNKGDKTNVKVRSRIVVQEIKVNKWETPLRSDPAFRNKEGTP